jgi:hypothetical protein
MYQIDHPDISAEFQNFWNLAGATLGNQADKHLMWLRADLYHPYVDHLSFRLGNQNFSVLLDFSGTDRARKYPIDSERQIKFCEKAGLHPCLFPFRQGLFRRITPASDGWNLVDSRTGDPVVPPALISDARIPMTDWEIHDLAVQIARRKLEKDGKAITSFQTMLDLDPQIWFRDEDGKIRWVVVRPARFPVTAVDPPANIDAIAESCVKVAAGGYFASVQVAGRSPDGKPIVDMFRGYPCDIQYPTLVAIT